MKNLLSIMAVATFMFSMNVNAQEPKQKSKKEVAKTEKAAADKKSCGTDAKSSCCSKKAENKKAE